MLVPRRAENRAGYPSKMGGHPPEEGRPREEPTGGVTAQPACGGTGCPQRNADDGAMIDGRRPSLTGTREAGRATVIGAALVGDELAGQRRLLTSRGIGMDHALRNGLVEDANRLLYRRGSRWRLGPDGLAGGLHRRPDPGPDRPVPDASPFALPDPFLGGLDVGHVKGKYPRVSHLSRDFSEESSA